jgi:hypothetical protein
MKQDETIVELLVEQIGLQNSLHVTDGKVKFLGFQFDSLTTQLLHLKRGDEWLAYILILLLCGGCGHKCEPIRECVCDLQLPISLT